jgi:hypothetical protein
MEEIEMKRSILFVLAVILVLSLVGCGASDENAATDDRTAEEQDPSVYSDEYIVIEATENHLLVAEIGQDGEVNEAMQYSIPNYFPPNNEISVGQKVTIKHNGEILESYPMQFAKIYSMGYHDSETGLNVVVNIDCPTRSSVTVKSSASAGLFV